MNRKRPNWENRNNYLKLVKMFEKETIKYYSNNRVWVY